MAWVYILKCSDESYYAGSTSLIDKRIKEHKTGAFYSYTKERLPFIAVFLKSSSQLKKQYELKE